MRYLSILFLSASAAGLLLYLVQLAALAWHRHRRARAAPALPPISILRPLCGHDDDLATLLDEVASLPYPDYEVLLGVRAPGAPCDAVDHPLGVVGRACGQVLARREQRHIDVPAEEPLRGLLIEPRRLRVAPASGMRLGRGQVVAARGVGRRHRHRRAQRRREDHRGQDGGCLPAAKTCVQHERMRSCCQRR